MTPTYVHWRHSLASLDQSWADILAAGDVRTARTRILKAAVFAACTAHTQVEQAEYEYQTWIDTGDLPTDGTNLAEQKASAILTADAWVETLDIDTLRAFDGWTLAEALAANVYGLATTKASFAAALVGYPEPYCLDTHALQHARDTGATDWTLSQLRSRIRRWAFYRSLGDQVFGSRDAQWALFAERVPAFAEEGHAVYFDSVLS
jgi:hypothetical protein